ncbi:response regulator transcription factor [Sphingomonas sp.]|uniref:response regulator transcription factor n=1 Tax=Sphingomonas sp. TaxID=28214 RepID=UPI001B20819A|nr:response regulator transcription factor [Sphingomonas sp.]MBO9712118.1 response regulator transcription factor [Sphingomonas sp.]
MNAPVLPATLNLLLVEDDAALAGIIADELRSFGHQVQVAADGPEAIRSVSETPYDAVILDRMLPSLDGVTVLERLRGTQVTVPIIMLSALGRSKEKIEGLEAGADDYVVKPVPAEELNARIHAVLRGRGWTGTGSGSGDTLRAGDITLSPTRFRAWRDGKAIDLPRIEFKLLAEFVRNPDTVLTRAMLLERVWGYDFDPGTNLVDAYIRRLRIKLTADGGEDPIATVRGVGYLLRG